MSETESYHEHTVGGIAAAGGDLFINSALNSDDDLALLHSNDVYLHGAQLSAGGDAYVMAGSDVHLDSVTETHLEHERRSRRGTFGVTGSGRTETEQQLLHIGSEVVADNDVVIVAGRDLNATASYIGAANNVELYAGQVDEQGDINLNARHHEQLSHSEHQRKSFGISINSDSISFGSDRENTDSVSLAINAGTVVEADNNLITRSRDINITGSTLVAGNDMDIEATRFANIHANQDATAAEQGRTTRRDTLSWGSDSNSVSIFAGHERQDQWEQQTHQGVAANQLHAGGNLLIHAGEDLNASGSDFTSGQTMRLTADNDINITERHDIYGTYTEDTLTRTGLTLTANHNLGNARDALENVGRGGDAISNVSGVLRAADALNNIAPSASAHLGQTQTTVAHTADATIARGVTFNAGEDLHMEAGNNVTITGAQGHAERNLVIHGTNVSMDAADNTQRGTTTTDFLQTGVTLQASPNNASLTAGFSQADSNLDTTQVTTTGSQFSAGQDATITADNDLTLIGSHVQAGRHLTVDAGNDVFLGAAQEYTTSDYSANHTSAGVGFNLGTDGVGYTGYLAAGEEDLSRNNQYHTNTTLTAGDTLELRSGNDTHLEGANLLARHLDIDVGNDLYAGSLQDAGDASGRRWDASVSATVGAGASFGVSVGYGETEGSSAWVNHQTSLIGTESVNVSVGNHTQLDGALIANIREDGTDGGNLNISTHTLGHSDLHDHDQERSTYLNAGFSTGGSLGANQQTSARQDSDNASVTLDGSYQNHHREQVTRATIGEGTVTVRNDANTGENSLLDLNRDIDLAQEITRDDGRDIDIYGSNTAVQSIGGLTNLDSSNTVFQWADQAQSLGDVGTWSEIGDIAARMSVLLAATAIDPDLSLGDINQAIAVRNGITQSVMVLNNENASPEQQQEAAEYLVINMLPWDTENPEAVALRDIMAQSLGELMVTDPARGEEALELLGQFVRDMNTPQEDLVFVAIPPAAQALLVLLGVGGTAAVVATDTGQELASSAIDGVAQGIGNTYTGIAGWIGGPQTEEQVFGRELSDAEIYARLQPGQAYSRDDGTVLVRTEDGYEWSTQEGNNLLGNYRLIGPETLGQQGGYQAYDGDRLGSLANPAGTYAGLGSTTTEPMTQEQGYAGGYQAYDGDRLTGTQTDATPMGLPTTMLSDSNGINVSMGPEGHTNTHVFGENGSLSNIRFASQAEADEAFKQYEIARNTDSEIVLGRLPDTEAGSQLGMTLLNSDNWSQNVNDAFVQGGIDAKKPFYLGSSPDISNYRAAWNALEGNRGEHPQTVFFREMKQLRDAGYRLEGNYMLPPN